MARRCFSPPEIMRPRSPTRVEYWWGRERTVGWMRAEVAAEMMAESAEDGDEEIVEDEEGGDDVGEGVEGGGASKDARSSGDPYAMLCLMVLLKRGVSCGTTPMFLRSDSRVTSLMSVPSIRIRPA